MVTNTRYWLVDNCYQARNLACNRLFKHLFQSQHKIWPKLVSSQRKGSFQWNEFIKREIVWASQDFVVYHHSNVLSGCHMATYVGSRITFVATFVKCFHWQWTLSFCVDPSREPAASISPHESSVKVSSNWIYTCTVHLVKEVDYNICRREVYFFYC